MTDPAYPTLTEPDDLAANRAGRISAAQRRRLDELDNRLNSEFYRAVMSMSAPAAVMVALWAVGGTSVYAWVYLIGGTVAGLMLLLLTWVAIEYVQRSFFQPRLSSQTISAAEGEVTARADNNGYEIKGIKLVYSTGLNLPPGRYQFFYLKPSRRLLSAEPLAEGAAPAVARAADPQAAPPLAAEPLPAAASPGTPSPDPAAPPATAPDLARLTEAVNAANGVAPEWLAENRAGRLHPAQRDRLRNKAVGQSGYYLLPGLVGLVMLVGAVVVPGLFRPGLAWYLGLMVNCLAGVLALGGLGLAWLSLMMVRSTRAFRGDADEGRAVWVEGIGAKEEVRVEANSAAGRAPGRRSTYYYRIGSARYEVPFECFNALVDGLRYRLYYAPRSRAFLSIEALAEG